MFSRYTVYSLLHNYTEFTGKYGYDYDNDELMTTGALKTRRRYTGFTTKRSLTMTDSTSLQEMPHSIPQHDDEFNCRESHTLSLSTSRSRRDQELAFLSLPFF